jgi:hypothetical protein
MKKETIQEEINTLRHSIELLEENQIKFTREPSLREFVVWLDSKPDLGENTELLGTAGNIKELLKAFLCQEEEGRTFGTVKT